MNARQKENSGGKENARAAGDGKVVQATGEEDAEELCDAREKEIGFCGEDVGGFAAIKAKGGFQGRDGSFDGGAELVGFIERGVVA